MKSGSVAMAAPIAAALPVLDLPVGLAVDGPVDRAVSALLRTVAREVVMPRFGQLRDGEVIEKTPGELVTIADHEAEERLTAGLSAILPDARVVGEEACAASPRLLDGLDDGLVWIVDPIDGTGNFANARAPFGIMVALVDHGDVIGGWIFDPVRRRLCRAFRDGGAWVDGMRLRTAPRTRARPVASLATQFMAPADRHAVETRAAGAFDMVPIPRCAAEHYPRVALGENDVAMFQRCLPWDHAAGTLLLVEAGGVATHWDGSPYRVGDGRHGLLVASNRADWAVAHRIIFKDGLPPTYRG